VLAARRVERLEATRAIVEQAGRRAITAGYITGTTLVVDGGLTAL
jgi:hypothetical protein